MYTHKVKGEGPCTVVLYSMYIVYNNVRATKCQKSDTIYSAAHFNFIKSMVSWRQQGGLHTFKQRKKQTYL